MCDVDVSLPLKQVVSEVISLLQRLQIPDASKVVDASPHQTPRQSRAPSSQRQQKTLAASKDKYQRLEQLGEKGKEGTVYLVQTDAGEQFAMKQFAKTKSEKTLAKEAALLGKAAEFGIAPKMIEYDTNNNFIVMEKLDRSLFEIMRDNGGKLNKGLQREMINIFKVLDRIQIFHADPSPLNFMVDANGKLKIIDFGFAKPIDIKMEREQGTKEVNMKFMPFGFILKMKEFVEPATFPVLLMYVSEQERAMLGIEEEKQAKLPSVSRPKKVTLKKEVEPPVASPPQRRIRIMPPVPEKRKRSVVKKSVRGKKK